jgi:uroporphyrinogen III methyltransferase/synthase
MKKGKVWLVGAGPGDQGLFTIKGKEVLRNADVVLYDSLVGPGVLAMIPDSARTINVGKRSSHHTMPQWKMNELIMEEAQKGNRVVRLKGGDPFLFGRGGEEIELLAENGIPFEIVPGITSPIAVPAYNGIPVTHRDFTSSLHVITGHKKAGDTYDIDFHALVQTGGTLVFLMGIASLDDICAGLLDAGMDPDMPAAVLQKGTTARQKRIIATVSTLSGEVQRQGVETPAIIVVGKVCSLADTFEWYEKLPLAGYRVLVTRPRGLSSEMSARLRAEGAEVLEIPAIATVPIENNLKLIYAIQNLRNYQWIVFTSPSGVKIFFDQMRTSEVDIRNLAGLKIASIGKGTARELGKYGLIPDLIPPRYDGEALGEWIARRANPGDRILLPRAEIGNKAILEKLKDFTVDDVPTYHTVYLRSEAVNETALFEQGEIDCAAFTSSSGVWAFQKNNPDLDYSLVKAACIGKQTQAAADAAWMKTFCADAATIESLLELIVRMHSQDQINK